MSLGVEISFEISSRYPDERVEVLDERFLTLKLFSASVERLATGLRWAEGPVWFGDGRYLLVSDIPNNRILRWDDTSGALSEFRKPSNHSNGLGRDRQGRLLTCEHLTRRVTRTEYDGRICVLADHFDGKPLNSPNDIICQRNGDLWFTDPPFGISGYWEGEPATSELPEAVYCLRNGTLRQVLTDVPGPNGLAFSPDETRLYVVASRARPHRQVWTYDVDAQGRLGNPSVLIDAQGPGALDGIAVDVSGHLWCGWGSDGSLGAKSDELDGVRVFTPQGQAIAHIHLPERCANLCFGGEKNNRLFMASSHSLYALYTNTQGANPTL